MVAPPPILSTVQTVDQPAQIGQGQEPQSMEPLLCESPKYRRNATERQDHQGITGACYSTHRARMDGRIFKM